MASFVILSILFYAHKNTILKGAHMLHQSDKEVHGTHNIKSPCSKQALEMGKACQG